MIRASDMRQTRRHYADNCERLAGETHFGTQDAGVAQKPAPPQSIAQNDFMMISRQLRIQSKRAAEQRLPSKQPEVAMRDAHAGEPFRPLCCGELKIFADEQRKIIEHAILFPIIQEIVRIHGELGK